MSKKKDVQDFNVDQLLAESDDDEDDEEFINQILNKGKPT
jgi:hypothetical protein